ncbi:DUF6809 family protein [Lacrimispora sp.]|uniref:DUF6809 family protein n=1 Tax=Lacrimispora sp. TaxID=2719234 RepID=UPI0028969F57|nr:DUF6809 family protein [Lacrimispora sp.]
MSQIIKDLYYGNISPWEKSFDRDSEYGKELKTVSETEEKLLSLLKEAEKELLQAFSDAHGNMSRIAIADGFIDGFCLGMRIATEVMQKQY